MEVKKIVEGMTAVEVAEVIDSNFKNQNKILEEDIAKQNSVIGVSEYKVFSEAEAVNVGDVRKYEGFLYECVEATTGAFDARKWKKSSFKAETEKMISELGLEVNSLNVERGFEVLNPIGINGVYVLDGVITVQQSQKINVIRVKKGDELTVAKKETSTSSLRFGVYDEFPKIGSSTSIYKTESDSFSYEVEKDGYFAVSSYLTDIVAFSMKSKRYKQIEENNEKLTKISEETKLEIGSLKAKLLTSTPSNPNSFNLINPNNSIEGYYIGSVGNFIENPDYSVAVIPMFGNNVSVVHSGGFYLAAVDENMNVTHVNEYNANNSEGKRIPYKYGDVYVLVSFKKTYRDYVAYYSNISGSANLPYNNYAEYSKVKAAARYGESLMDINFLNSETDLIKRKVNLSRKVEEFYISAAGSLETNAVNRLAIYMFPVGADTFFYVEGKISSTNNVSCVVLSSGVSTTGVRYIEDRAKGCNGDFSYFGKTDEANTWVWVISDMDYEPTVIGLHKEPIFVSTKNLARYIYKGIYLDSSGSIGENKDYCVTDYISLSEEIGSLVVSVDGMMQSEGSANIIAYDENKQFVKYLGNITETKGVAKWEDGISYVRFSVRNYGSDKVQVEKGIESTDYISPLLIKENYIGYYIPEQPKAEVYNPVINISEELTEGQSYSASKTNYIRKNNLLTAHIETNGIFDSFTFGLGKNAYRGYWLTVTDTQIIVTSTGDSINEVVNHDMTLENVVDVIVDIDSEWKGTVRLQSKGVSKIFNIAKWVGAGALFVQNSGNSSKKAEVSLFSKDLKSDIWGYGDSYFSFNDSSRWIYYLLNWGYDNMLLDHLPGAASATMYNALLVDLELGKPKYMLWALGMNDSADTTEVNDTWLSYIQKFISICKSKNITPILCTIPSVPNKSHELKSEWVRNSGCRYIDFAKAVGAQSDGTWFDGMLSSDKVHPTSKGAIALASQAICDFPELTNLVR